MAALEYRDSAYAVGVMQVRHRVAAGADTATAIGPVKLEAERHIARTHHRRAQLARQHGLCDGRLVAEQRARGQGWRSGKTRGRKRTVLYLAICSTRAQG